MAHPKRKHSHSRTCKKRTHQKVLSPSLVKCSQCKKFKPKSMVCPFCGYYKDKEVIRIEQKKDKKKKGKA